MDETPNSWEVTFNGLAYGGDALGRLPDGRAVFVPLALPGERARVQAVEEKRGHVRARLVEVLEPSPRRIPPRCVHFGVCGGCHYQHMAYADQLAAKTGILREQLQRLAGLEDPPVLPMLADPRGWDYRNTVQFHLTAEGKVGYQKLGSNETFAIRECHLLESGLDAVWPALDLQPLPGLERVSLRLGAGEDVLLALESLDPNPPEMMLDLPISVVHLHEYGPILMAGDDFLVMEVLGRPFKVSAGSFFQVNTLQAARIIELVLEAAGLRPGSAPSADAGGSVLDLYCGVGLFSAFLAPLAARLVGVESSPAACDDFAVNLDEFEHVELYQGRAEDILPGLDLRPRVVVADPPRAGLAPAVVDMLMRMQPERLVYVSCDPATLARDLRRLLAGGYHLEHVQPVDMFPQTFHIESVSLLTRGEERPDKEN